MYPYSEKVRAWKAVLYALIGLCVLMLVMGGGKAFWFDVIFVILLIVSLLTVIILNRERFKGNIERSEEKWNKYPSWARISIKTSLFAVLALFVVMLSFSLIDAFKNNFSCSTCLFFGLCSGGSSLGGCFFWPTIGFLVFVIPAAIIGAFAGIMIHLITSFVKKIQNKEMSLKDAFGFSWKKMTIFLILIVITSYLMTESLIAKHTYDASGSQRLLMNISYIFNPFQSMGDFFSIVLGALYLFFISCVISASIGKNGKK